MQNRLKSSFDLMQMYQTIGTRRLIRFGITMGIALAGQVLVTISIGTLPWVQQHIIFMVLIELVWWPPFFCILYFSFIGVVKLVEQGSQTYKHLRTQLETTYQDYEKRCSLYEQRLQEQDIKLNRLSLINHKRLHLTRLEPLQSGHKR
jgi:hypothetical protein